MLLQRRLPEGRKLKGELVNNLLTEVRASNKVARHQLLLATPVQSTTTPPLRRANALLLCREDCNLWLEPTCRRV
ncbi:hypothetical protein CSUI_001854 [Cystoisospora suis]|uniref:Uncharacterized protein n=1 Tax=Cystoisospora suis TaxID=483139 RepID=A0A2C6KW04_9APIC|nr:hypothetical protein CSUI_001854 [Cystoisospora suis]